MSVSDESTDAPRRRIALFADVQNIYYTTRDAFGRQFNYTQLWQQISAQGEIVSAIAYATHKGDNQQHKFQQALRHIGFEVKLKQLIQRADGSAKGDWDVGLTIDMLDWAPRVDTVVLLSGDGDFADLLDAVSRKHGVTSWVYGVELLTAQSLIQSASRFCPIEEALLLN